MPPVKVIFGVRVTTACSVTLTPSESPGETPPDVTVDFEEDAWTVEELAEGDYILRVELPVGDWFGGTVAIETSEDVYFVTHRDPAHTTQQWQSHSGTVGGGEDPKDPWPPPGSQTSQGDMSWFINTLHDLHATISNPRDAPPPPDDE
jgi:hypothetical protein